MTRHLLSLMSQGASMVIAVIIVVGGAVVVRGQASPPPAGQSARPTIVDEMQATAMMAERQKMMANMRAFDQKLNDLIAKMDTARGDDDRIDAIAAVVREMAAQRTQMRGQMMAMQSRMMGHMMEHMTAMQGMAGMTNRGRAGAPQSMTNCPMMKEISKEATDADPHHPEK